MNIDAVLLPRNEILSIAEMGQRWKSIEMLKHEILSKSLILYHAFKIEGKDDYFVRPLKDSAGIVLTCEGESWHTYSTNASVPPDSEDVFVCLRLADVQGIEKLHPEYRLGGPSAGESLLARISSLEEQLEAVGNDKPGRLGSYKKVLYYFWRCETLEGLRDLKKDLQRAECVRDAKNKKSDLFDVNYEALAEIWGGLIKLRAKLGRERAKKEAEF